MAKFHCLHYLWYHLRNIMQIISLIVRFISIILAGNEHCNSIRRISSDRKFLRSRCYRIITHNITMAYALTWKAMRRGRTDYEKILLLPNFYMACLLCVFSYYRAVPSTLFCLRLSHCLVGTESGIKLANIIFLLGNYPDKNSKNITLFIAHIKIWYLNIYCIVDESNYEWQKMIFFDF